MRRLVLARPWQRRWVRLVTVGVVAFSGLLGLIGSRARVELERHRDELLEAVGQYAGLTIDAEELSVSFWPPQVLAEGVTIPDESPYGPGDLAHADEARLEVALLPLLRGQIVVTEVHLLNPVFRVVRGTDGGWNLVSRAPAQRPEHRDTGSGWRAPKVIVDTIRVRNARVNYRDRRIPGSGELELRTVNLRLRHRGDSLVFDFNAQALGGPEENLSGVLRVPDATSAEPKAKLEMRATHLAADQLPDVIGLLWSRLPFGVTLSGEFGAQVTGELPRAPWPPNEGTFDISLDGGATSFRSARGWVGKSAGVPLELQARVRAGSFGLAVDQATVASGAARLEAQAEGEEVAGGGQHPLAFRLAKVDAAVLAALLPPLARVAPSGGLTLTGRIRPTAGGLETEVAAQASSLSLRPGSERLLLGEAALDGAITEGGGKVRGNLTVTDAAGLGARVHSIGASVDGSAEAPLVVRVDAGDAERETARIERLRVECMVLHDGVDVRAIHLTGLQGAAEATGQVSLGPGGGYLASFEPKLHAIDLESLDRFFGLNLAVRGRVGGHASLATSGKTVVEALDNLHGELELALRDGTLPDLNLARLTLAKLGKVPHLYEAVERRARERAPELLVATSRISGLDLRGAISNRTVEVRELSLVSPEYSISASGKVAFDGATDLTGSLALTPEVSEGLLAEAALRGVLAEPGQSVDIPIIIRGDYPRVSSEPTPEFVASALRRAVGQAAGEKAAGFLKRLFGGGSGGGGT